MNRQFQKILASVLLIILTCFVLCIMITGGTELSDKWRFIVSFVFGIVAGCSAFLLWKSYFVNHNIPPLSSLIGILGCLLTFCAIFGVVDYASIHFGIDKNHDNNECINIDQELYVADTDEILSVFIFDNTKYGTSQIPDKLKNRYNIYLNRILKFCPNFNEVKDDYSYRNFFKVKLCADLLDFIEQKGKFSIYVLANKIEEVYSGNFSNLQSIENAIITLSNFQYRDYKEIESCYFSFYDRITSLIQIKDIFNPKEFNKYVLYAYGDFIHDKQITKIFTADNFQEEISNIEKKQAAIAHKSIVQNLYIIPFEEKRRKDNRKFILDTIVPDKNQEYKNIIFANQYQPDDDEKDKRYHRVKYLSDIPIYYSNTNELCSPKLHFDSKDYYVKITNERSLKKGQHISLKSDTEFPLTEQFQKISSKQVSILFKGNMPTQESVIFLDIAKKGGIHGIVRLDFRNSLPYFFRWLLPLICLFSGIWLGLFFIKKINK